jgi:hypothetical protein
MKNILRIFSLIALCFILVSCAKRRVVKPPEAVKPYEGPVTVEVLKGFLVFKDIDSLSSEVRVKVFKKGERLGKFRGVFVYVSPDAMRLRLFDPFGFTVMDMVSQGAFMQVFIPRKNVLYEGKTLLFMSSDLRYSMEEKEDRYVLYARRQGNGVMELVREYSFDRLTLLNTGISVYRDGRKFAEFRFDNFYGRVPGVIKGVFLNGFAVEMTLEETEIDADIPAGYFSPIEHEDKRVLPLQLLFHTPLR